jgi:hypothetical protein
MPMPDPLAGDFAALLHFFPAVGKLWHLPFWIDWIEQPDHNKDTLQNRFTCLVTHSRDNYDSVPRSVWECLPGLCGEPLDVQLALGGGVRAGMVATEGSGLTSDDRAGDVAIGEPTWGISACDTKIWHQTSQRQRVEMTPQQWIRIFGSNPEGFTDSFKLYVMEH